MALTNCEECQQEISSSARECPRCGMRRHSPSIFIQELGFDGTLFRLLIAVGIIAAFVWPLPGIALALFATLLLLIKSKF